MIPWETISPYFAPAGLAVLVMTFILRLRTQYRREAMRQQQTDAAREEAAESSGLTNNGGRGLPRQPSRLVKAETPFTGQDTAHNPARWEIEIDALGRQVVGQIQSKMVALQTLLLETERTAARVELILERLETSGAALAKLAAQTQQTKTTDNATTCQETAHQEESHPRTVAHNIERLELPPLPPPLSIARHAPEPKSDPPPLSIEALFQEFEMPQRPSLATTRSIVGGDSSRQSEHQSNITLLANYGYSPREIASRLNTSVGEVESLLKATG